MNPDTSSKAEQSKMKYAEILLACILVAWSFSLWPQSESQSNTLYKATITLMPGWTWVLALWITALLSIGGVLWRVLWLRKIALIGMMWLWVFLTFVFWQIPVVLPGRYFSPVLFMACLYFSAQVGKTQQ